MPIDKTGAAKMFQDRAPGASDKLLKKYKARTDKAARMASDEAQKNFEDAMKDPVVLKMRQHKLKEVSEGDLNKAMEDYGATNYATKTGLDSTREKYARNVSEYQDIIDREVAAMKPKSRDARTNVLNRVVPIAVAQQDHKKKKVV